MRERVSRIIFTCNRDHFWRTLISYLHPELSGSCQKSRSLRSTTIYLCVGIISSFRLSLEIYYVVSYEFHYIDSARKHAIFTYSQLVSDDILFSWKKNTCVFFYLALYLSRKIVFAILLKVINFNHTVEQCGGLCSMCSRD